MSNKRSGTMTSPGARPFIFLRNPIYLMTTLIITVYLSLLYYVFLLRGVMTPAIHARLGIPVSVAPFPWANVWETPQTYAAVLNGTGRPGELIFGLGILMSIIASLLTGIFISGVLYSRYRGFGAAGTSCAAAGSILTAAGVGCPTCLVPAAAALGIVIPLVALPLAGVEFLIANVLILVALLVWFARRVRRSSPSI